MMMFQIVFLGVRSFAVVAPELGNFSTFPLEMSSERIRILINFVTIGTLDLVSML